jgi:hypothetical protein
MKIIFRPIPHDPVEIIMGQSIWFHPCEDADAISVTANPEGFTTQNRVGQLLGYDQEVMINAAKACNEKYEIAILNKSTPPLLLVPQTYGKKDSLFLINDLFAACNQLKVKKLHFTHFGFIQKELPKSEVEQILRVMRHTLGESSIDTVVFDVDARVIDEIQQILQLNNLNSSLEERKHEADLDWCVRVLSTLNQNHRFFNSNYYPSDEERGRSSKSFKENIVSK